MNEHKFLNGQLLVAQPKHLTGHFVKSVVLVAQHSLSGAWGIVVNRPAQTINMQNIISAVGLEKVSLDGIVHNFESNETVYIGGPVEPTRVQVLHTLDWCTPSTFKVTDELGITGDISTLTAISVGQGPRLYRAGVGLAVWSAGQLDGEQSGISPWTKEHQWLTTPATVELCLTGNREEQWQRAINHCVNNRISELF